MLKSPKPRGRRILAALATALLASACNDPSLQAPTTPTLPPVAPMATPVGRFRGTVDLAKGTLTFAPIRPAATTTLTSPTAPGLDPEIYGTQGVDVLLSNTRVVIDTLTSGTTTPVRFRATVYVQNLIATHPIGDEQAGTPVDPTGIFVFFTSTPVVTNPTTCTGCAVNIESDGTLSFDTQQKEPYFYWPDQLGAAGQTNDITTENKVWEFDASLGVQNFSFDVSLSAAWPPGYGQTSWKVDYEADSLPDTQSEPRWQRFLIPGTQADTEFASNGVLTLNGTRYGGSLALYRQDSLGTDEDAYMESKLKVAGRVTNWWLPNAPQAYLILDDGARFIALGISKTRAGFANTNLAFISNSTVAIGKGFHTYELQKYAADSAVFLVDGTRASVLPYSSFSANPLSFAPAELFGDASNGQSEMTKLKYTIFELGIPHP